MCLASLLALICESLRVGTSVSDGSAVGDHDDDNDSQSDSDDNIALVGSRLAGWNGAMDTISTKVDMIIFA